MPASMDMLWCHGCEVFVPRSDIVVASFPQGEWCLNCATKFLDRLDALPERCAEEDGGECNC